MLQQEGRVRLRQRDARTGFPTRTFPVDARSRSLQELSVSGQACMLLEVLSEGDEFEAYNPNEMVVCVHSWNAAANAPTKEKVDLYSRHVASPPLPVHGFDWQNALV